MYPKDLQTIITFLKKLPGVGSKTAERFAFELLKWPEAPLENFSSYIKDLHKRITQCKTCGCLEDEKECLFCENPTRDSSYLCIISTPRDVFAIEDTKVFKGLYHVIGSLLSPIDGLHPEKMRLDLLKKRLSNLQIKEIILALDSTLEGDATSLFLKEELNKMDIPTSRLAYGLPVGSSLEYIDEGTLSRAFTGRQSF